MSIAKLRRSLIPANSGKGLVLAMLFYIYQNPVKAQENKTRLEIYGAIVTDIGYDFNAIHPDWFDVMRPTKLPSRKNEYGTDGNVFFSMRQTKLGIRSVTSTGAGELKTQFDFDLFGFGASAGQTTFHLVNAFATLGKFTVGQTASTFMDMDVFPETLDYWGPMSRVFIFNIQVRYTPVQSEKTRWAIAIERPGATADGGDYSDKINIRQIRPVYKMPNIATHFRKTGKFGYIQLALLFKRMGWTDYSDTARYDLSGHAWGMGWNLGTVINLGKRIKVKLQAVQGKGIQSYIADATADVGLATVPGNSTMPYTGNAIPVFGVFGFTEIQWTEKWRSTLGYSTERVKNTDLQSTDAFKHGQYLLANCRYYPARNIMMGIEYQYGQRNNFNDGFQSHGNKLQFSFQYSFSCKPEF